MRSIFTTAWWILTKFSHKVERWTGLNPIENGRLWFNCLAIIFKNGVLRAVYYWQVLVSLLIYVIPLKLGNMKQVWIMQRCLIRGQKTEVLDIVDIKTYLMSHKDNNDDHSTSTRLNALVTRQHIWPFYLPKVTNTENRLFTIESIIASISVSFVSPLFIAVK